jgi:hypothetical protein
MSRSALVLALVLSAGAALSAAFARRSFAADRATEEVSARSAAPALVQASATPDIFSARIDRGDYLRNPDGSTRILFTNAGSSEVAVTICGSKNAQEASSRFGETGPLEIQLGEEAGKNVFVAGTIYRNQPFFALRFLVPAGSPEKPVHVYLFNADRDKAADLAWRLLVGDTR